MFSRPHVPHAQIERHLSRSRCFCLSMGMPGAIASPARASEEGWAATCTGMLLSAGLAVPRRVFGHGFLTAGGLKMGKSMGNVVDPLVLPPPLPRSSPCTALPGSYIARGSPRAWYVSGDDTNASIFAFGTKGSLLGPGSPTSSKVPCTHSDSYTVSGSLLDRPVAVSLCRD